MTTGTDDPAVRLGRRQRTALAVIRYAGKEGATSDEIAACLGTERWLMRPRCAELRNRKLIVDSGARRQNVTGRLATVWIANDRGGDDDQ